MRKDKVHIQFTVIVAEIISNGKRFSAQGNNDAPLVYNRYSLSLQSNSLGNLYGSLGQNPSGQGQDDNSLVHDRYSLWNKDNSLENFYDSLGKNPSGKGKNETGKVSASKTKDKLVARSSRPRRAVGISATLQLAAQKIKIAFNSSPLGGSPEGEGGSVANIIKQSIAYET